MDEQKSKRPWGAGRVAFLALLESVKSDVNEGWSLKEVYRRYAERLANITYSQFTYYVRRHITGETDVKTTRRRTPSKTATRPIGGNEPTKPAIGSPQFQYNPVSDPKKLIG
jgi:hypothetical protein